MGGDIALPFGALDGLVIEMNRFPVRRGEKQKSGRMAGKFPK